MEDFDYTGIIFSRIFYPNWSDFFNYYFNYFIILVEEDLISEIRNRMEEKEIVCNTLKEILDETERKTGKFSREM